MLSYIMEENKESSSSSLIGCAENTSHGKQKISVYQKNQDINKSGLEVIKREFILRLKIKRNDWLFADTCPQAANQ